MIKVSEEDIKHLMNTRQLALLVVDVQELFCSSTEGRGTRTTERKAGKIKSLSQEFRKAGVGVYGIHTKPFGGNKPFYKFTSAEEDRIVSKKTPSAFTNKYLQRYLKKDKKKTLLICGFNLNACVYATAMDARKKGYNVILLRDLTGNDAAKGNEHSRSWEYLKDMRDEGVSIVQSSKALSLIKGGQHG